MLKVIGILTASLGFLGNPIAQAGGPRNADGKIQIPLSADIRQFDAQKIELVYRGKILIIPINYAGLPKNLDPKPGESVQIKFSLNDWSKFSDKIQNFRLGSETRIDLIDELK